MPVKNGIETNFVTISSDLKATDYYESVDMLNRLPFSQSPLVEYISDFDESVDDFGDAAYNGDGKRKMSF